MTKSTLDDWIAEKIGADKEQLTYQSIEAYQLSMLRQVIAAAKERSFYYKHALADIEPEMVQIKKDLDLLPLTEQHAVQKKPEGFLWVSPSKISRIVTLQSSGTTGQSKRIFFCDADLELTIDFFRWGMANLADPGDNVLILMPGERPGSIGDLLIQALKRHGCRAWCEWPPADCNMISRIIMNRKINVIIGIPSWMRTLALYWQENMAGCRHGIKNILLSADRTGFVVRKTLEKVWNCRVYDHYGSSEMGYGGGVECGAHQGYHLREADLLFEIVDPVSGLRLANGNVGEVVFSTLTREGMPLLRYRTGDLASIATQACRCGSVLPLMSSIQGRLTDLLFIDGKALSALQMDEIMLSFKEVADYKASFDATSRLLLIKISLRTLPQDVEHLKERIRSELKGQNVIQDFLAADGALSLEIDRGVLALQGHMQKRSVFVELVGKGGEDCGA